jgi:hypothetical protein
MALYYLIVTTYDNLTLIMALYYLTIMALDLFNCNDGLSEDLNEKRIKLVDLMNI